MEKLSSYVLSLRQESGLDKAGFAKELGTNTTTVRNIENGKHDLKVPSSKVVDFLAEYVDEPPIKVMQKFINIEPNLSRKDLFAHSPFSTYENYHQLFTSFSARLEYLRVGNQTLSPDLHSIPNFLSFDISGKYKSAATTLSLVSFFTTGMSIVAQQYCQFQEIRDRSILFNDDFESWFLSWTQRFDFYNIVIDKMFSDSIMYGSRRSTIIIFVFNESNRIEKEAFEYLSENLDVSNLPPYFYTLFLYRDGSVKSAAIKEYNEFKNVFYNF